MAKFIKLTDRNGEVIHHVNIERIDKFHVSFLRETGSIVSFGDDYFIHVKETPEEIIKLIEATN